MRSNTPSFPTALTASALASNGLAPVRRITASRSEARGFTLIELMVTLVVLAVMATLAAPGFSAFINNNRLAGLNNEFVATLETARMESIRRGQRVVVCPTSDGINCGAGARWNGWISFADRNGNNTPDAGETLRAEVLAEPMQLWSSTAISASGSRIVFRRDGFAYDRSGTTLLAANMSACIPTTMPEENARDISIIGGGRVAAKRRNAAGACGAPANP